MTASYSQKVTDHRLSEGSCSGVHCKPTRLLQQCLSLDQCWRSTSSAVSPQCRCLTHHVVPSGNMNTLQQHFVTTYTGCLFVSE